MIKISIITINYNNLAGLKKTFESVIFQKYLDFEFIIIDGGSSDGSKEFIESNLEKINYFVSESDNGVYHAMNKGLINSTGDYCLFLNSGDFFYDENVLLDISKVLDFSIDLLYGCIIWTENNELWSPKRDFKSFEVTNYSPIPHQATFYRTALLKKNGGYKEEFKVVSDWGVMLEFIIQKKNLKKIDRIISFCEPAGISSSDLKYNKREYISYLIKYHPILLLIGFIYRLKKACFS